MKVVSTCGPSSLDDHEVLDPDSAQAGVVDPGLDRADPVSAAQHVVALGAQARELVHLQPEAMAQPVAEEVSEALGRDQVARDRVHLAAARARPYRLERRQLCAQADVVRARQLVRQIARREGARAVRAVVAELRRRVDDDRLTPLDHPVARAGVRLRAARARPTITGKAASSAPSSCISDSNHQASSFSVRPTKDCSASRSKHSLVIAAARLIASSSASSLTARTPDQAPVAGRARTRSPRASRTGRRSATPPGTRSGRRRARRAPSRVAGSATTSIPELARLLHVPEVREQPGAVRLDQERRVRQAQPGQVEDVRPRWRRAAAPRSRARTRSSRASFTCSPPGTRAPPGSPPGPCRSRASRRGRRSPSARRHSSRSSMFERCTSTTGTLKQLDRVADRVAVVRPGARVDDDAVGPVERVVAPLDVLALVVRLPAAHRAARARSPTRRSASPARRDRQPAVQRRGRDDRPRRG